MHFVAKSIKKANTSKTLNTKNASVVPQAEIASARVKKKKKKKKKPANGCKEALGINNWDFLQISCSKT